MEEMKQKGFTIVELLIVIVVIGILAAIVIVAFNGVQARANDSAAKSDLGALRKSMLLYKTSKGELPVLGDTYTADLSPSTCNSWTSILSVMSAEGVGQNLSYIDPWNHCYVYDDNDCGSGAPAGSASWVRSAGPDGVLYNSDDISVEVTRAC